MSAAEENHERSEADALDAAMNGQFQAFAWPRRGGGCWNLHRDIVWDDDPEFRAKSFPGKGQQYFWSAPAERSGEALWQVWSGLKEKRRRRFALPAHSKVLVVGLNRFDLNPLRP